jgi:F-type H+-transporting ATPase subunit a
MASEAQTEGGFHIAPMDQFRIKDFFSGSTEISTFTFTNQAFWMVLTIIAIALVFVVGTRGRATVPSRSQSIAEVIYQFAYKMIEDIAGKDGVKYFPYIMTLFMFILFSNLLGLIPMSFTATSHFAVTGVLALLVFITVTVIGFVKNGVGFLKLFWVSDAPLVLRPILAVIEVVSYFVRPLSHSVRLGGNILAGHAVLKVFAGFAAGLGAFFFMPILSISVMYALETLVACVQAYVFAILTCVYLHDALHPGH